MRVELDTAEESANEPRGLELSELSREFFMDQNVVIAVLDLLAHWWSRPVAEEVEIWLGARELEEELLTHVPGSPESLSARIADVNVMVEEYEELFIGPGPVPCSPYESYWRNDVSIDIRRTLMGPCIVDLNRLYGEMGLEVTPHSGELPDHIAIEFEALAYSLSRSDGETIAHALFFDHVMKWLLRFTNSVTREAHVPFYGELARVTRNWLEALAPFFRSIANDDLTLG